MVLASLCAAAGLLTIWPSVQSLYSIWTTDDLKSMGMVVPLVCYLLILRAWKSLDWETNGSWWGFAVLAGSAALMFLRDQMLLIVTINKNWLLQLPPLPLVAVIYAAGMVLLFGGTRLLKAAWFPVLFMWAVIPVPQTFSRLVDLPLQHASATRGPGLGACARPTAYPGQTSADVYPGVRDVHRAWLQRHSRRDYPGSGRRRGRLPLSLPLVCLRAGRGGRRAAGIPVQLPAALPAGHLLQDRRCPTHGCSTTRKIADYVIGGCLFVCALAIFFTVANKLRNDPDTTTQPPPSRTARSVTPSNARQAANLAASARDAPCS